MQIDGSTGAYSTQTSGSDVLVKVGNNTITLKNVYVSADNIHINGDTIALEHRKNFTLTDGADIVFIGRDSISVDTGAGNDTIFGGNYANNFNVSTCDYNDHIHNHSNSVSIDGGKRNDYIYSYGSKVSIDGGSGDDFIKSETNNVTIADDSGNDTISNNYDIYNKSVSYDDYGSNVLFVYNAGDNNNVIYGFNETSTLKLGGAISTYSTKAKGRIFWFRSVKKLSNLKARLVYRLSISLSATQAWTSPF